MLRKTTMSIRQKLRITLDDLSTGRAANLDDGIDADFTG
jgi:hypothetical protein